jgi:hypothetical protein
VCGATQGHAKCRSRGCNRLHLLQV